MKIHSGSIGFPAVLTIVFVIMKLTHFISWSWVWVLAPTWISLALSVVMSVLILLAAVVIKRLDHHV